MNHLVLAITASYKGGCGKSTLGVGLAQHRAKQGDQVFFLDTDFTGTSLADALVEYPNTRPTHLNEWLRTPPAANPVKAEECVDEIPVDSTPAHVIRLAASRIDGPHERDRLLPLLLPGGEIPYAALRLDSFIRECLETSDRTTTLVVIDNGPGFYGLVEHLKTEPLLRTIESSLRDRDPGGRWFDHVTVLFLHLTSGDRQDLKLAGELLALDWLERVFGPKSRFRGRIRDLARDRDKSLGESLDLDEKTTKKEERRRKAKVRLHLKIAPVVNLFDLPAGLLTPEQFRRLDPQDNEPNAIWNAGSSALQDRLVTISYNVQDSKYPKPGLLFVPYDDWIRKNQFNVFASPPSTTKSSKGATVLLDPGLDQQPSLKLFLDAMDALIANP